MINFEELIQSLILPLVVYPQDVKIESEESDNEIRYNVSCNVLDVGRVIGKNGSIVTAVRTIVYAAASKEGRKVFINVIT